MFGLGALFDDLIQALKKPVDLVMTEALYHMVLWILIEYGRL